MAATNSRNEVIFLALGELSDEDIDQVTEFLTARGLTASVRPFEHFVELVTAENSEGLSAIMHHEKVVLPSFQTIKDRDDFITREHFEEFRQKFTPDFTKRAANTAFSGCIDVFPQIKALSLAKPEMRDRHKDFISAGPTQRQYPSLIVRSRSEVGLPSPKKS